MLISSEIVIKSTVRSGSVFYFPEETFKSKEPHYFVVLNAEPLKDGEIMLVCAVSFGPGIYNLMDQSDFPAETFVNVTPEECLILKNITVFNCNQVFEKSIDELVEKMENNVLKMCGYIEDKILERLRKGVKLSPQVEEGLKKFL